MPHSEKKVVLVASGSAEQIKRLESMIHLQYPGSTVYTAEDGSDAWAKALNHPPHVFIIDAELPKVSGQRILEQVLHQSKLSGTALILLGSLPKDAVHLDEFVTGRLQFLDADETPADFAICLAKGMNFANHGKFSDFQIRFLVAGERLLSEGEQAESVYIVRTGIMRAFRTIYGKEMLLGHVEAGEFVGEMAYINGEPRMANVEAVAGCELIEIPVGTLDRLLYRRPSWSKILMQTLAKRLKKANETRVSGKVKSVV